MSAKILDGKSVRDQILAELRPRIDKLKAAHRPPGLAVVLVGNDPASEIYVRNKIKTCEDLGIYSESCTPPDTITTEELLAVVVQQSANRTDALRAERCAGLQLGNDEIEQQAAVGEG